MELNKINEFSHGNSEASEKLEKPESYRVKGKKKKPH